MDLFKRDNECDRQFIWRIGKAKEQGYIDLSWDEIADIFNEELTEIKTKEEKMSSSTYRQQYRIACLYYEDVFKEELESTTNEDLTEQLEEIRKEKYKLFDQRNAYNKLIRDRARQEEINEIVKNAINNGDLPKLDYSKVSIVENTSDDVMLINLHDIHYGANIKNYWNEYNSDICKQRIELYLRKIEDIQNTHKCKKCVVAVNGDCISGNIHQSIAITNKENVIEQIIGVSELLAQFLVKLTSYFENIEFATVSGNHSRFAKKDDAVKGERLDVLVKWYLEARLQNFSKINFKECQEIDSTMYLIDIAGKLYCGTHGDYDGNINKITDIQAMLHKDIYALLCGHLHHNKIDSAQGIKLIMSGSIMGMDDYCIEKRIYGEPEQLVCIVNEKGLKCAYDVNLKA